MLFSIIGKWLIDEGCLDFLHKISFRNTFNELGAKINKSQNTNWIQISGFSCFIRFFYTITLDAINFIEIYKNYTYIII